MVSEKITIQVRKCHQASRESHQRPCIQEGSDEIIKTIALESWSIEKKIDFTKYGEEPTYSVMNLMSAVLLNPEIS